MQITFEGKTVVITGGTSGIGKASALLFLEAGARVIVLGRDERKIAGELDRHKERLFFFRCELTDPAQIEAVFLRVRQQFGRINVLVNNAGIQTYGTALNTDKSLWDQTFDVNIKSAFLCTRQAIPLMKAASGPAIINVGSVQGYVSQKNVAAYATSKEALHGFTRSVAIDFAPHIRCVGVSPGSVMTPMLEKDLEAYEDKESILEETKNIHLLKRIAAPEEIANFILFLASDKAAFATGHTYRVDGGIGLCIQGT
ncbi:MAG TPA: SDR family oxidoreductase [Agriterribacter sp.]|nr:SDR family oxidoreductase [Agriterribacter sp.]